MLVDYCLNRYSNPLQIDLCHYLGKYLLFTFCSICIAQTDTDLYELQDFETYLKEEIVSQRAAGIEVLINHKGPLISESGIKNKEELLDLKRKTSIKTFLIGESLLKNLDKNSIFSVL